MICSNCTLFHPEYVTVCRHCGSTLRPAMTRLSTSVLDNLPTGIGAFAGVSLLSCLSTALIFPAVAGQAFAAGSVFGLISITNIWIGAYREGTGEWMQGMRGFGYTVALLVSLVAELARLQGMEYLPMPHLFDLPARIPVPWRWRRSLLPCL